MSIMLIIKVITFFTFLIWYFQHKYKPFLYFILVYSLIFTNDIWKLIKSIYYFPDNVVLTVDKIIILSGVPILIVMIFIIWKMFKEK